MKLTRRGLFALFAGAPIAATTATRSNRTYASSLTKLAQGEPINTWGTVLNGHLIAMDREIAGEWSNGSNIRFHRGEPQTISGWESPA